MKSIKNISEVKTAFLSVHFIQKIYVKCSVYKFNGMTSLKIYVSVYKYTNLPTVSDLSNVRVYII